MQPSEETLLTQAVTLLKLNRFLVAHFRPARTVKGWRTAMTGDIGFPDIVAVGHGATVVIETKSERGRLRPEQHRWLEAFGAAPTHTLVLRPSNWNDLEALIAEIRQKR